MKSPTKYFGSGSPSPGPSEWRFGPRYVPSALQRVTGSGEGVRPHLGWIPGGDRDLDRGGLAGAGGSPAGTPMGILIGILIGRLRRSTNASSNIESGDFESGSDRDPDREAPLLQRSL